MKLQIIFKNYLNYLKFYRKKGTYLAYRKDFKLLTRCLSNLNYSLINDLTVDSFDFMIRWLKINTKKKNSKINDTMSSFLTALNYSKISYNFNIVRLVDDTTPFKILNDDELVLLFKYLDSLDLSLTNNLVWVTTVYLALDTGARKNELINIKTTDVDFTNKTIYLNTTKNEKRRVKFGKLSEEYIKLIFNIENKYLLHNRLKKQQLTNKSIEYFFERINKNVILTSGNVTLHRLRKTLATKLYINCMPLPTIQHILGHSDVRMTMKYIDVSSIVMDQHYKDYYPY